MNGTPLALRYQRSNDEIKKNNLDSYRGCHELDILDSLATITSYRCHQEISKGEDSRYWYRIVSGAAKRCATQRDGRRQMLNLLLPGDFFGLVAEGESDLTVEVLVEHTQIAKYPRQRIEALADVDPKVARLVRAIAFQAILRLESQLLIVGRVTAREKVAAFLIEMGERLPLETADKIALPISRSDIAEFLAISVETVSRSLTVLKQRGLIKFCDTRHVSIVDREAIEDGDAACRARL